MPVYEQSIDVNVPVSTAYNQWTQFEDFPQFMEGIESIDQKDDKHLHWKANIAGVNQEWDAEITEQHPDERVAWKSLNGATNAGVVTFHRLNDSETRVMLQIEYDPEGFIENVGAALGVVEGRMSGDLRNFKQFIEKRGTPTGEWRGEIEKNPQG